MMVEKNKDIDEDKEEIIEDESELEENIGEIEENIDDNRFIEFLTPSTESSTPILERFESAPQESLEKDIEFTPIQSKKEEDIIKYDVQEDYESFGEELRREKNENILVRRPAPIDIERVGRDLSPNINEVGLINAELQELRRDSGNLEKNYVAKAEKLNQENFRLPFEQEERKYKGKPI